MDIIKSMLYYLYHSIKTLLNYVFSIFDGTDVEGTIKTISDGISVRGATAWILICGAMLASIGLDTNSSAVIIGAMLISPLMSSILGIGLSIGISDREMLFRSLKNFGIATVLSMATSTIYFSITPLGDITTEMTARIRPTLLDVGVAIFGGVAGIVANSRIEKTNAIPGVAIATALMPPLCTSGFGLATGNYAYFFGAFYLFFINAFFISLSTYTIVRFLKFPMKEFVDQNYKRKMKRWIITFSFIVTLPSVFFLYNIIIEVRYKQHVDSFIAEQINSKDHEVINWNPMETDSVTILKMYLVGEPIGNADLDSLQKKLELYKLTDTRLKLIQMNVSQEDRERLVDNVKSDLIKQIDMKVKVQEKIKEEKDFIIDSLNSLIGQKDSFIAQISIDSLQLVQMLREMEIAFPEVHRISYGMMSVAESDSVKQMLPTAIVDLEKGLRGRAKTKFENKFTEFIKVRLLNDSLIVLFN